MTLRLQLYDTLLGQYDKHVTWIFLIYREHVFLLIS